MTEPVAVTGAADSHCSSVNAIARCTGYVCSAGGDAAIRVWKSRTLQPVTCARPPTIVAARQHSRRRHVSPVSELWQL